MMVEATRKIGSSTHGGFLEGAPGSFPKLIIYNSSFLFGLVWVYGRFIYIVTRFIKIYIMIYL